MDRLKIFGTSCLVGWLIGVLFVCLFALVWYFLSEAIKAIHIQ